jgi:rhodanese-related sulfurtransferase
MAQKLMELGYRNVHPLYGGFDAWVDLGGEVEKK